MIRALRPSAMAQDDASPIGGWNIAPNFAYALRLLPGPVSCGVFLYASDGATLVASGAALTGTEQPCILIPQAGQTVEMVDADLGWHLLLTTTGTESQRTIRIGPAVDLPDEIHPVYGEDDLALVRAAAAIDAAAHYIDDATVTCPLGLGAVLGDVVSVPVDGAAVAGQVESITWTATPDGAIEQAVIRRHVAIAPEPFVEPVPPTVSDDAVETNSVTSASGNVLANDDEGLTIVAVAGLSANVGVEVPGSNGGVFVIEPDGAWAFDPDGDFGDVPLGDTEDTSVIYHASNGETEASATLTVTVSRYETPPVAVDDEAETDADSTTSGNVLTNDTDAENDPLSVSEVNGAAANIGEEVAGSDGGTFIVNADGSWTFDPGTDFSGLTGEQTATTSVEYTVTDGIEDDTGILTVTVSSAAIPFTPSTITTALWYDAGDEDSLTLVDGVVSQINDKSGNAKHLTQATASMRPTPISSGQNGLGTLSFDGGDQLQLTGQADIGTGGIHIFQVWKAGSSLGTYFRPPLLLDNGQLGKPLQRFATASTSYLRLGGTPNINPPVNIRTKTSFCIHLLSAVNNSPRDLEEWFDGALSYSGTSTNTYDVTSQKITLGVGDYSSYVYKGEFCEAVVIAGTMSSTTREKIEGYLAHRWGLTASLPSGHPYKTIAPTV